MSLSNLSIGGRLALILAIILVSSATGSLYGIVQLRRANAETEVMPSDHVRTERLLADWLRTSSIGTIDGSKLVEETGRLSGVIGTFPLVDTAAGWSATAQRR